MALVKFHTRTLDKASGVTYEPSNEFVEVSEAFALRIKELMQDERHKGSWEFDGSKSVKSDVVVEPKTDGKPRKKKDD